VPIQKFRNSEEMKSRSPLDRDVTLQQHIAGILARSAAAPAIRAAHGGLQVPHLRGHVGAAGRLGARACSGRLGAKARTFQRILSGMDAGCRLRRWAAACLLLLNPLPAPAATVLRGTPCRRARRQIVDDAAVVVEGKRITCAGKVDDCPASAGATRLELGDVTLVAGVFDLHTHLPVGRSVRGGRPSQLFEPGPPDIALRAAENAGVTLAAGFTTVREAGAIDFVDVALSRAIEAGWAVGPRIVPSGYQISMTGGHGGATSSDMGSHHQGHRHRRRIGLGSYCRR
jgi:hypothetical protein